jgi:hypothetical protein
MSISGNKGSNIRIKIDESSVGRNGWKAAITLTNVEREKWSAGARRDLLPGRLQCFQDQDRIPGGSANNAGEGSQHN